MMLLSESSGGKNNKKKGASDKRGYTPLRSENKKGYSSVLFVSLGGPVCCSCYCSSFISGVPLLLGAPMFCRHLLRSILNGKMLHIGYSTLLLISCNGGMRRAADTLL